jgi:hypothetical protein
MPEMTTNRRPGWQTGLRADRRRLWRCCSTFT